MAAIMSFPAAKMPCRGSNTAAAWLRIFGSIPG
jgi:hypothetical protein